MAYLGADTKVLLRCFPSETYYGRNSMSIFEGKGQKLIQNPITHLNMDLFVKIFNGVRRVNLSTSRELSIPKSSTGEHIIQINNQ